MTDRAISHSSQSSMTRITKVLVCAVLSGMVHIKDPLLLMERIAKVVAAAGFLPHCLEIKCVETFAKLNISFLLSIH